jgi:L-lactate dehydrogenase complex protein LldG
VARAVSAARDAVLGRIRGALADVDASGDAAVPRDYRMRTDGDAAAVTALFVDRLTDYLATARASALDGIAAAAGEICASRGVRRLLVPAGLPAGWRPGGVEIVEDHGLGVDALDAVDGVLTGSALAIAETGTIALDGGPAQGRRAITLVPDLHICVVEKAAIVAGVPEGMARLGDAAREGRAVTLVSGPSATSDIELSRVEGVHGPRTLEVIVAG